jgi:hypothetical protein
MTDAEKELRDQIYRRPCGFASCHCARLLLDGKSLRAVSMQVGRVCPGVRAVRKFNSDQAMENIRKNVI